MVKAAAFPGAAPYVVAAIDGNHDGRLAMARRLVTLAASAGAHAVKFSIAGDAGASTTILSPAAWRELRREARGRLDFIAAPQDAAGLKIARALRPDAYQIDPVALADPSLIDGIAKERRPVVLVAGGCTTATLAGALRRLPAVPVVILHTVLADALPASSARLRYLSWLGTRFKRPVGYFGCESGAGWAFVAAALGAVIVEKRFTLDRSLPGASHAGSVDPAELGAIVTGLKDLAIALEPVSSRRVFREELPAIDRTGHSLVARRGMTRGHRLSAKDVVSKPSVAGLSPQLAVWLTGRRLKYDVEAGEPITFGMVDVG